MTNTHPNGWRVGMKVVVVRTLNRRNGPDISEEEITKIGRKWIYLPSGRFDVDTLWLDSGGYTSPGKVYPSLQDYEESTELHKAFHSLRARIAYAPNEGVTFADVCAAAALLRIELGDGQ